jgi:Mrp family chromosome partitioning ATPase
MGIFKKRRATLVSIHEDNANTKDWLILLEAATIVGHQREKLRVALTTQARKLIKKRKLFGKPELFLDLDGYDPRIHALYFCPQLYKNEDGELVALSGQEVGQLMARALEGGSIERPPWYEPSDGASKEPVIKSSHEMEFDSLVVDAPSAKANKPAALRSVAVLDQQKGNS